MIPSPAGRRGSSAPTASPSMSHGSTRTSWSWTTSLRRSAARARPASVGPTCSVRPGRSGRCTNRPRPAGWSDSDPPRTRRRARRRFRSGDGRDRLRAKDDDLQGLGPALDGERPSLDARLVPAGGAPGRGADQQLARAGVGSEAGRHVDGIAEGREVEAIVGADRPDEGLAGMDADADLDAAGDERPVLDGAKHGLAGLDRPDRMLATRDHRDEQRHDPVAEELVDGPIVLVDRLRRPVVELLDEPPKLARRRPLGDPGRAPDVGKEDADLDLGAARAAAPE